MRAEFPGPEVSLEERLRRFLAYRAAMTPEARAEYDAGWDRALGSVDAYVHMTGRLPPAGSPFHPKHPDYWGAR